MKEQDDGLGYLRRENESLRTQLAEARRIATERNAAYELAINTLTDLQREVERLKAELETEKIDNDSEVSIMHNEYDELKADNERLREAAEPFVNWLNELDAVHTTSIRTNRVPTKMTYAQFDKLRTALAQPEPEEKTDG